MQQAEALPRAAIFDRVAAYVDRAWPDLAGRDPYDALNSPILRRFAGAGRLRRLACLQLVRRSPFDVRSLLGIQPHVNPKTVSLMARAHIERAPDRASRYLQWLEEHATTGYSGACWGYSFPWQSRRLWMERGAPSAVCTAFVARAFLDAYAASGAAHCLDVAHSAAGFLLRDCPRYRGCISYLPGHVVLVHNANLLAASVLADVWRYGGARDSDMRDVAAAATEFSLADQRADGSWRYDASSSARSSFVDGFHTGLVLEAIHDLGCALAQDYSAALEKGLSFYRREMIGPDGRPRRVLGRNAATDIRDCAEALMVLARFKQFAQRDLVLDWTLRHMLDPRGYFVFEYGTLLAHLNRIPFPRWQAWMLLALA